LGFLALITVCTSSILIIIGLADINDSALQVSNLHQFNAPTQYELSAEQQAVRQKRDTPDSFTILFYEDDIGGDSVRHETWIYATEGERYTWINGVWDSYESFPALTDEIIPIPYTPEQFTAYMDLEEVLGASGIDEFLQIPLEEELVAGGESYFADRLAFGLKENALLYVEAVGFSAENETANNADTTAQIAEVTATEIPPTPTNPPQATATSPPATKLPPTETPTVTPIPPTATAKLWFPNFPLVYSSDKDAPAHDTCHPQGNCPTDIFYNPAPSEQAAINLTKSLGIISSHSPTLSPDGNRIAFAGRAEIDGPQFIWLINTDGSGLDILTLSDSIDDHPTWSPDGKQIAFMRSSIGETNSSLMVVDVATTEITVLTSGKAMDRFPDWSPDGTILAFHSNRLDPNPDSCWPECQFVIYLIEVESRLLHPLGSADDPYYGSSADWSPDGNRLAFQSARKDNYDIHIINGDGTLFRLTDDPDDEFLPSWSPDGLFIAYISSTAEGVSIGATAVDSFDPIFFTDGATFDTQPDW
jgi:hypothetical protein